jgi:MFS family permease
MRRTVTVLAFLTTHGVTVRISGNVWHTTPPPKGSLVVVAQVDITQSLQEGLTTVVNILPAILAFLAILIIGYIIAKVIAKALDAVLGRVGFDRAVERGGVRRALERTEYDASDILSRIVFYALMLFVLQLAFGVFGPNPVSELLSGVIAFLPRVFVAIVIVVLAMAIAAAVRDIVRGALGGLAYGGAVANVASGAIIAVGIFAALNQLQIAPAIVNGLFYALLAIVAGSAIIAIGGGGVMPMRRQWEKAMGRLEEEAPKMRQQAATADGNGGRSRTPADDPGQPRESTRGTAGEGAARRAEQDHTGTRPGTTGPQAGNTTPPGRRPAR